MKTEVVPSGARVRDVMTEAVMFLITDQTLEEAYEYLRTNGLTGAPVLNRGGRLVGIVSLTDLADPRRRKPETAARVKDAMTRVVYAVRADDPVMVAVHLMIQENIHRAVVVRADGTIAGIVAPMDILRASAQGIDIRDPAVKGSKLEFVDLRNMT